MSLFIPIPEKGNAKECSDYHTIALVSHASKVMLKIFQVRLQQYVNHELPYVQGGIRNAGRTRDQIANICWIIGKQENSIKTAIFALLIMPKPLTVQITARLLKIPILKRWEYQTIIPASGEIYIQVKKQQLELDREQQSGSKSGKEYIKAVYCHPAYLTSMQSTS